MNTAASNSPLMMRKSESWRLKRLMSVMAMVSPRRRGFALTTTVSMRRWISVNAPRPATLTTIPARSVRQVFPARAGRSSVASLAASRRPRTMRTTP
jgi:hypothetical protein